MNIEHLPLTKVHTGAVRSLDSLTSQKPLARMATNFIMSRQVEGLSKRTIESYTAVLTRFLSSLDSRNSGPEEIRLFLLGLQQDGLGPHSVHIYYRNLRAFFKWLVSEDYIPKSPMKNIKPPKLPNLVIRPFSPQDINNLLLVTSGKRFVDIRNRAIVLLFLDTGVRLGEMAASKLEDIDIDSGKIKIFGKGAKERHVRMGKTTTRALFKYLSIRTDPYDCLWVTEERKPLTQFGVKILIRRLCAWAEIKDAKRGAHTFRHTAAINYLRNGGDIFTLQSMLGHSSLSMVRRYLSSLGIDDLIRVHKKASPVDNLGIK